MRGKEGVRGSVANISGITPAHAGKSYQEFEEYQAEQDHPRTCGEKNLNHRTFFYRVGSPPHMRGKGIEKGKRFNEIRITPAHAGKSFIGIRLDSSERDHPRTCGEKYIIYD